MDTYAKKPSDTTKGNFKIITGANPQSPLDSTEDVTTLMAKYHNVRQMMRVFVNDVIHDAENNLHSNQSSPPWASKESRNIQEKGRPQSAKNKKALKISNVVESRDEVKSPSSSILSESRSPTSSVNEDGTVDLLKYPAIATEDKFHEYRGTVYQPKRSPEDSTEDQDESSEDTGRKTSDTSDHEVTYRSEVSIIDNEEKDETKPITVDDIPPPPSAGILAHTLIENPDDENSDDSKESKSSRDLKDFLSKESNGNSSDSDEEIGKMANTQSSRNPSAPSGTSGNKSAPRPKPHDENPSKGKSGGSNRSAAPGRGPHDGADQPCNQSRGSPLQRGAQEPCKILTQKELEALQDNIQRVNDWVATVDVNALAANPTLVTELTNLLCVSSAVLKSSSSEQCNKFSGYSIQPQEHSQNDKHCSFKSETLQPENTRKCNEKNTQIPENIYPDVSSQRRDYSQNADHCTNIGPYSQETPRRYPQGYPERDQVYSQTQESSLSECHDQQNYVQNTSCVPVTCSYSHGSIPQYTQDKALNPCSSRYESHSEHEVYETQYDALRNARPFSRDYTKRYNGRSISPITSWNPLCRTRQDFRDNSVESPQDNRGSTFTEFPCSTLRSNFYSDTQEHYRKNEQSHYREDFQGRTDGNFLNNDEQRLDANQYSSQNTHPNRLETQQSQYPQNTPGYNAPLTYGNSDCYCKNDLDYSLNSIPNSSGYAQDSYLRKAPETDSGYIGPYCSKDNAGSFLSGECNPCSTENTRLFPTFSQDRSNSQYVCPYSPSPALSHSKQYSSETEGIYKSGADDVYPREHTNAFYSQEIGGNPPHYHNAGNISSVSEMSLHEGQSLRYCPREGYEHDISHRPIAFEHKENYGHSAEFNQPGEYGNDDNYPHQRGYWDQREYEQQKGYAARCINDSQEDFGRANRFSDQHANLSQYEGEERYGREEGVAIRGSYNYHQEGRERNEIHYSSENPDESQQFGHPEYLGRESKCLKGKKNRTMSSTVDSVKYRFENCANCEMLNLIPKARIHLHSVDGLNRLPVFKIRRSKLCVVNSKVNKMLDRIFPFYSMTAIQKYNKKVSTRNSIDRKLSLKQIPKEFLNRHPRKSI